MEETIQLRDQPKHPDANYDQNLDAWVLDDVAYHDPQCTDPVDLVAESQVPILTDTVPSSEA